MKTQADPFENTHESVRHVTADDPRVKKEAILVNGVTPYVILRVENLPIGVYIEWMVLAETVQKNGLLFDPKTRLAVRPLRPPPRDLTTEEKFMEAVSRGDYRSKLPRGANGSADFQAYRQDQERLSAQFRTDLEAVYLPERIPPGVRDALYTRVTDLDDSSFRDFAEAYRPEAELVVLTYDAGRENR